MRVRNAHNLVICFPSRILQIFKTQEEFLSYMSTCEFSPCPITEPGV
jgi:hypothetical protein